MSRTADQIAADRARYEEHQRKGLQFAPKALPGPSPLPPPELDATSVIHVETIPGGWYWWTGLKRGEAVRISRPTASSVAMLAWNAADPTERLNLPDTIKVQWTTTVSKGRVLFSDMGRVLFSVIEDSSGAHDGLAGGSTAASSAADYPGTPARNTRDNFVLIAGKLGLNRRDIPSVLSFFAPVRVGDDGGFSWQPELLHAHDYVDLRAEMDLLVGFSNCPHPLDPNPDYAPGPAMVTRYRAPVAGVDDVSRIATAEAVRGFENNAFALA